MLKKQFFIDNWLFLSIFLLGIVFRFLPISTYQFSHDELSGLNRTIFPTFKETIYFGVMFTDTHPALIQVFLWIWVKFVGYNEIWIKLPFLISGLLSVIIMYRFCMQFFHKNTAVLSSIFVSLSFIFLLYSSYARMYAPGILFSILLLEQSYYILFSSQNLNKHLVLYTIYALLCAYNHHMSCFFAFTLSILTFLYLPYTHKLKFIIACFVVSSLYLPTLFVTLHQLSIGGIGASAGGWLSEPRINELYYFVITLFGTGKIGLMIFIFILLIALHYIFQLNPISKKQIFLLWLFIINYSVIHFYSVFRNPILQNSVLLFSGIALIIFLCSFSSHLTNKQLSFISIIIICLLNYQIIFKKNYFSKIHVQDFESQIQTTIQYNQTFGDKNVFSIFKSEPFFVYLYEKKYQEKIKYKHLFDSVFYDSKYLLKFVSNLKENVIVLGGLSAGEIQMIKKYFPYLLLHQEDYFRNLTVLSKIDYTHYEDVSILDVKKPLNKKLEIHYKKNKTICFRNDSINLILNQTDDEFPLSFKLPLKNSDLKSGQFLIAKLNYKTDSLNFIGNDKMCISISEQNKDAIFYKEVKLKDFKIDTNKLSEAYLEIFLNDQLPKWKKENLDLTIFIWKDKGSYFKICDFELIHADYNPTKWTLWN